MIYSTGTFPPLRKSSLLLTTGGKGEKIPRELCNDLHFMMYSPVEQDHVRWTGYKHLYLITFSVQELESWKNSTS